MHWIKRTSSLTLGFYSVLVLAFAKTEKEGLLFEHFSHEDYEPLTTPVFVEEPLASYLIRTEPATLSCKAKHALQVYFECNGHLAESRQHSVQQYVDPMTGVRQVEVSIDVTPSDVGSLFVGDTYSCYCFAWSSTGRIKSSRAVVSMAAIDGRWTSWSTWSNCGPDCLQHRHRTCTNPAPAYGGRICHGKDQLTLKCADGPCKEGNKKDKSALGYGAEEATSAEKEDEVALIVGVFVAVTVFLMVSVAMVMLVRRIKGHYPCTFRGASVQPELTQTTQGNYIQIHGGFSESIFATLPSQRTPLCSSPAHGGLLLLDHFQQPRSSTSSTLKNRLESRSSEDSSAASTMLISDHETMPVEHIATNPVQPPDLGIECIAWGTVTSKGGRISIPGSGICLTVPPGSVDNGAKVEMYIAVLREDKYRPELSAKETILSPTVMLGPRNVVLKKSVIFSFQHCAVLDACNWKLSMYTDESDPEEDNPSWKINVTLGQETLNTPMYCQLDEHVCYVVTDNLCRYALIGETEDRGAPAVKALTLAAFAPTLSSVDYNTRVYCVEDTKSALQGVMQLEHKLGGKLLDHPKSMSFQDGGYSLCLNVDRIAEGWMCKPGGNYQEIPFQHVWNGRQNNLHCSFTLENMDPSQRVRCRILVNQKRIEEHRQEINVNPHEFDKINCEVASNLNCDNQYLSSTVRLNKSGTSTVSLDEPVTGFRLKQPVRKQLMKYLDPPTLEGNDWRRLAQKLQIDRYINYFATKPSPTDCILDLWEARNRGKSATIDLLNTIRSMGQEEAALVLEKESGSWL